MKIIIRPEYRFLPPGTPAQMHVIASFSAPVPEQAPPARNPISLALVIDRSGSMGGEKLDRTKQAITEMVRLLTRRDRVTLVTFDTEVQHPIALTQVTDKPGLFQTIETIGAGSSTNLSGGWLKGLTAIQEQFDAGHLSRVILLTDGQANHGITDAEKLVAMAYAFREKGISTTTFGFGSDFNENLLKEIAKSGGGNFYFISRPEDAVTSFRAEFGEISRLAGQNCEIGFHLPEGVRLIEDFTQYRQEEIPDGVRFFPGDLVEGVDGQIILKLELAREFCEGKKNVLSFDYKYNSAFGAFDLVKNREDVSYTFREGSAELFLDDEVLDEIILAKTAKAKLIASGETAKGEKGKALSLLDEREKVIGERLRSGKSMQTELLSVEMDQLQKLKKEIVGNPRNLGKTVQSQVEEYVKKRGAYIQGRKEKRFVFNKILEVWNKPAQEEFLNETRTRLTDLGMEHDFMDKGLFCLVELMANAISHGCKGKRDGEIQVKGIFRRGGCVIQVSDSGTGFPVNEVLEKARKRLPQSVPGDLIAGKAGSAPGESGGKKDSEKGRGIALMLALGAELTYTGSGREAMVRLQNKVAEGILSPDPASIAPGGGKKCVLVRNHPWKGRVIPELVLDRDSTFHDGAVFRESAASLKQKGIMECILNMEKVEVINSLGIAELIDLISTIVDAGGRVGIIVTRPVVIQCLKLVGISSLAHLSGTLDEALAAFPDAAP